MATPWSTSLAQLDLCLQITVGGGGGCNQAICAQSSESLRSAFTGHMTKAVPGVCHLMTSMSFWWCTETGAYAQASMALSSGILSRYQPSPRPEYLACSATYC